MKIKYIVLSTVCVVVWTACAMEKVKGRVQLFTSPSPVEFADYYETSSELWIRQAMHGLRMRQRDEGIADGITPINAVVELQEIPSFKVIAKTKVEPDGRYYIETKGTGLPCRLYCRTASKEFGEKKVFVAVAAVNKWVERERAYVQDLVLRRDSVSVVGRCIDTNGLPVINAAVDVSLITTPIETSEIFHSSQIARTDENGCWRVDGVDAPVFDRLISYVCNTNVISIFDSSCPPYEISVGACAGSFSAQEPKANVVVPNVSAEARIAVEKVFAAYKRKTGKDWPRPAPMTDFPVSTNNVIYVPDIVLKRTEIK